MSGAIKSWKCTHCNRRFTDPNGVMQHHKQKHRGKKLADDIKAALHDNDDDESFADRAIAAELDHAMGIDNPDYDWLVEPYK